jgi:ABC-2 type transport system ATP-binding protein
LRGTQPATPRAGAVLLIKCRATHEPLPIPEVAMSGFAIETFELTRTFGAQTAVDHLSLQVPEGSFYGFLGPNGAGKSTTINMLTGLLSPTSGSARILGLDLAKDDLEIKRRIGVVPDGLHLFERLSGEDQLRFVGEVQGLAPPVAKRRAGELLEAMDLTASARKLVAGYSHGMRKKLALSCALIHEPKLLFLDEPFEGVDAVSTSEIRELLQRLVSQRHVTVFLTSHVLEVVERLCTHVGIVSGGKLVANGSLDDLRRGEHGETSTLEELFLSRVGGSRGDATAGLGWLTDGEAAE